MVRSDIMSVDFTPSRGSYTELRPFRFWCQKVLPLVYDDALSYYELLCKVVDFLNKTMEDVETLEGDVTSMYTAYDQLQQYVNDYFDNLDVQDEINAKLDQMAEDGSLSTIMLPLIRAEVTRWLGDNIEPTTPPIDASLSVSGAGADAKVTGDNFALSMMYRSTGNITDANNLPTGMYIIITNNLPNWTNIPDTNSGIIIHSFVYGNSGDQLAMNFANSSVPNIWRRTRSGGTWGAWYKEVDSTLTVSGVSADSKVTGDNFAKAMLYRPVGNITDANDLPTGMYIIITDNLPNWSNIPDTDSGIIIHSFVYGNSGDQLALNFANSSVPNIWRRTCSTGTWGAWYKMVDTTLTVSGVSADSKVTGDNFAKAMMYRVTSIRDANDLPTGIYHIITENLSQWSNLPNTTRGIILETFVYGRTGNQIAFNFANNVYPVMWYRNKSGDVWGAWYTLNPNAYMVQSKATSGMDANDFEVGTCYTVTADSALVSNLPFTRIACIVKTYSMFDRPNAKVQTVESWANNYTGVFAIRNNQGSGWSDWVIVRDEAPNKHLGFTLITDSLGSGYISSDDGTSGADYYELSWGMHLARKLGCKCYISGSSGQSAVQWVSSTTYGRLGLFSRLPATPVYFITMGINDANQDVTESAFKTAYNTIITSIKNKQPDAVIICLSVFRGTNPWVAYNAYIEDVVNTFTQPNDKVFYLNVTNDIVNDSGISAHLHYGHYDVIGYALIGDLILNKFYTLANTYPSVFRTAFGNMITSHPNATSGYPYPY